MTRLLLFTNEYPYRTGDVVFVEKEIEALAAAFDDVVVFCHARDTSAGMVELPDGVRYGGNLFEPAPEDAPRQLLEVQAIGQFLAAAWRELWTGRLLRHPKLFVLGVKVGITQAHRVAVRQAIAGSDDVVAYGFWAMGGGLGLPWLRGVRARVARVHGYDLYEERAVSGYLPYRPYYFSRVDRVLTISADGKRYLEGQHHGIAAKTTVSRLGVWGPAEFTRPAQAETITIVSCSSVSPIKRVDLIRRAVGAMAQSRPEAKLRWVHFGEGPLSQELTEAVDGMDLPRVTIELRGQTANIDVLAFYRQERVDLFVNASTTEGVPVSIMEAIAHDIPIVATAVGGTPEIVGDSQRTGMLVAADASARQLSDAMGEVLDAPESRYAPRETWKRDYDARRTAQTAADLIRTAGR
ncbi:glycosyltransferase [Microbacterium sp. A84]|uniref:glycosyltransferase n=1 Tax=Microbacterium sp. A84 TaxID=3450715 RepID=UPI003F43C2A3